VVIAAFSRWHERHDIARAAIADGGVLIAHVALETYSVLTRLPAPMRADADAVLAFLERQFPAPLIALDGRAYSRLLSLAADARVVGGGIYDALVAAVAAAEGLTLLSLDARAASRYRLVGAEHRLLPG
jgi:predicted nucleic acid-binding protein